MTELVNNRGRTTLTKGDALLLLGDVVGRERTHSQTCVIDTLDDVDRGNAITVGHDPQEVNVAIDCQRPQQL